MVMKSRIKNIIKPAFIATIPVMSGYIVLGFGFGIILKSNGYGTLLTLVMSLFIYAGSMQYVAIGLITGGASMLTAALTTLMVNARHLFYGISMLDKYKGMGMLKPYLIFSLTDETYSLVVGDNDDISAKDKKAYYFIISLFNHFYWVFGSVFGAVCGSLIRFNTSGIDFALTALFLTVFIEQWLTSKNHISAIVGVAASVLSLFIFGTDKFLIPAMAFIALLLCCFKEDRNNE